MNKKHLATAFAVFAATTMSFSAFAATIDANARAYERASAEQYSYPAPQAATPAYQTSYAVSYTHLDVYKRQHLQLQESPLAAWLLRHGCPSPLRICAK